MTRIAIVARRTPAPEPQHDHYRCCAAARGLDVVDVDIAVFVNGGVDVEVGASVVVGGVSVDEVGAVLVGPLPGAAARTSPDGVTLTSTEHAARTRTQLERHHLARGVLRDLEARGVPLLSPSSSWAFDEKPTQLLALRRAGLPLPKTWLSDSGEQSADLVVKAIGGGPARAGVRPVRGAPAIVQERVRGADLRAVVVGGVCLGVGRFDDDDDRVVDVRERASFVDGSGRWVNDDADDAASVAVAAAAVCGVDVAAVDLKRARDGALFVLEVNRTPVWLDLERDLGLPIADRVIDLVVARAQAARR